MSFARVLPRGNLAGSLYGLILVTSVIVTLSGQSVERMGVALVVTSAVFALAHAWAHALAEAAAKDAAVDRHHLGVSLAREWPIVEAALPAAILLALAAAGLYSPDTALWIAAGVNVVLLFAWGAGLRELAGGTLAQVLAAGMSTASLGLVLVALKVLVH
jgi:hypothetical protein